MKKILAIALACIFPLAFAACGGTSTGGSTGSSGSSSVTDSTDTGATETPEIPEGLVGVNGEELIETLSSTPYKSKIDNNKYGLTAPYNVGADEGAFSTVLYPVPESADHIYNVADYGVTVGGATNKRNLNQLILDVKEVSGTKQFVFEKGVYEFDGTISLKGVSDVYFVGNGADFVFTSWCVAFELENTKNIHFNDISIDYDPSPVVAGRVKSCNTDTNQITIALTDEFNLSADWYNDGVINYGSYMEFKEDANGVLYPNTDGNLLYNSTGDKVKNIMGGSYNATKNELTLTFKVMKPVSAGVKVSVAFTMYEYATFTATDCEDVYMEGCNIYCSAGMTFLFHTVHNTYLNRTNLMLKEGSDRLMTATADGFHGNDCTGDIVITGSIYENSHDDSINICSFYKTVSEYSANKLKCSSSSASTNYPINAGDVIEVYNPKTLEYLGEYTVESVKVSALVYTLTVDKYIRDDIKGMLIGNATRNPKVRINDCLFRNKRNRGILLQSRDSDISNNTFSNVVHGAISLHSVLDIFSEAITPRNITVTNNKFLNNNEGYGLDGEVAIFAYGSNHKSVANSIKNIKIENNFTFNSARSAVSIKSSGEVSVLNNLFYNPGWKDGGHNMGVRVYVSVGVTVTDNCVVNKSARDGFSIVYSEIDDELTEENNTLQIIN